MNVQIGWGSNQPCHRVQGRNTVTMMVVAELRKWVEGCLGAESSMLVIERMGDRNRVALRFFLPDAIEYDVATLRDLRAQRLTEPDLQQALLLLGTRGTA